MPTLRLIIEKTKQGFLGRVTYRNNLLIAESRQLGKLEQKMLELLAEFEGLPANRVSFDHHYDLTSLFEKFDYLKISRIADAAGVNASLLRQYVTGKKQASAAQAMRIEIAVKEIGKELQQVNIYSSRKE